MTSILGVIILVSAFLILPRATALSASPLRPTNGSSEKINIGAAKTVQRTFAAKKGNLIIYGVGNDSTDSSIYFNIINSAGKRVDGCMSFCSVIPTKAGQYSFLPTATGTYALAFYFASRSVTGTVHLSLLDAVKYRAATLSGTATAEVSATDVTKVHSFLGTKGNLIIYGLGNDSTDSSIYFNIFNSAGKRVDGCVSFCAEIPTKASQYSFLPSATGTYYLALHFAAASTAGNVHVSLLDVVKNRLPMLSGTAQLNVLATDVTKVQPFLGTKGNLIIYGVGNDSKDSSIYFNIFNSAGKRMDGCVSFCAEIPNKAGQYSFLPSATGTYYLALHFANASTAANLSISLVDVIANHPQTVSGTFAASFLATDVVRVFQFTATEGGELIYEVGNKSTQSSIYFNIFNSAGARVDGCVSFCSEVATRADRYTFTSAATGTYYLALHFATAFNPGTVDLSFP